MVLIFLYLMLRLVTAIGLIDTTKADLLKADHRFCLCGSAKTYGAHVEGCDNLSFSKHLKNRLKTRFLSVHTPTALRVVETNVV